MATNAKLKSANPLSKSVTFVYEIGITGACGIDACTTGNINFRCLYVTGCVCGIAGSVSSGLAIYNFTGPVNLFEVAAKGAASVFF